MLEVVIEIELDGVGVGVAVVFTGRDRAARGIESHSAYKVIELRLGKQLLSASPNIENTQFAVAGELPLYAQVVLVREGIDLVAVDACHTVEGVRRGWEPRDRGGCIRDTPARRYGRRRCSGLWHCSRRVVRDVG